MDLFPIDKVTVNPVTTELLRDIHETAEKVNELRPLSDDLVASIQRDLIGERVYSSNALEGNTYSLGETIEILKTGYIELGRKREATEVVNLGNAIAFVQSSLVSDTAPYSEQNLLQLHRILLTGIDDSIAGVFRNRGVMILGAKHQPPDERAITGLISEFLRQLREAEKTADPIVLAAWAHWSIARIHPFMDGNGRMSRLWQDLVLFRHRLTCAIIPPESRNEYLDSLKAADGEDFNPLVQLVCRRIAATFDRYIAAQQKADAQSQWARELVGETTARANQKRRLEYERWRRKMEELRYAFERCASTITHISPDTQIQFKQFEVLDQAAWENIRSGIGAGRTWFFQLIFRRHGLSWSYFFFFGKHYWSDMDSDRDRAEPRVCLLIAEQVGGQEESVRLDQSPNNVVTIRELLRRNLIGRCLTTNWCRIQSHKTLFAKLCCIESHDGDRSNSLTPRTMISGEKVFDNSYTDLDGHVYGLATLGDDELELIRRLRGFAANHPDWYEYSNYWMPEVARFGESRGLSREDTTQTAAWRIAQDLGGRLAISAGIASPPDYRDELDLLSKMKFRTRREFCAATGLSEDMLSHVLAKRKNLSIDALTEALGQIGYTIHIAPLPDMK
jgi:Fic family protein